MDGHRFQHDVFLVWNDDRRMRQALLLTLCEGGSNEPWPPSPPLQSCLPHEEGLLGIGMAGGHWSMALKQTAKTLTWDIAGRFKKLPEFLGSTYQRSIDLTDADRGNRWLLPKGQFCQNSAQQDRRCRFDAELPDTDRSGPTANCTDADRHAAGYGTMAVPAAATTGQRPRRAHPYGMSSLAPPSRIHDN